MVIPLGITFKQPTQRDFVTVFKWCYQRLDPGFQFTKTWDTDLYTILKTIQYPYLNSITKSQISAVGGSNWPKFLGMLHWIVQIMKNLDMSLTGIDQNIVDQNTQDMTILTNHNSTTLLGKDEQELKMIKYESMAEKVFIEFITESYKNFLQMNDDMSKCISKLEKNFGKFTKIIETDITIIDELNTNLKTKFSSIMENFSKLKDLQSNNAILQKDYNKMDNFVKLMQTKKNEWSVKLEKIEHEIELKTLNIRELKEKIMQFEKKLDQKGFSIAEIQQKMELQTEISKNLKIIESNLEMVQNSQKSTNLEYNKLSKILENSVMKYNFTLESLNGGAPNDVSMHDLQLSMDTISMAKIQSINELLNSWNNKINKNIITLQQKNMQIEATIESLQTEIENKNVYITDLENQYLIRKNEIEIKMQNFETQILEKQCDIEKLENKITELNQQVNDYLHNAQDEINLKEREYKELSESCERRESAIVDKVKEIVEYVENFQNKFKSEQLQANNYKPTISNVSE
ncbi:hypothetical protein ACO0QE_000084 [Hanseniaspora vineae]